MRWLCCFALIAPLPACDSTARGETYYLYRSTVIGSSAERIHVATFDASEGRGYNEENCTIVRRLMENQPGVQVAYWCTQLRP